MCTETPVRPEPLLQLNARGQEPRVMTSCAADGRKVKVNSRRDLGAGAGEVVLSGEERSENIKRPCLVFVFHF